MDKKVVLEMYDAANDLLRNLYDADEYATVNRL
jgi:hypothetical protein